MKNKLSISKIIIKVECENISSEKEIVIDTVDKMLKLKDVVFDCIVELKNELEFTGQITK